MSPAFDFFGENKMKAYGVKKKDAGCCPGHDKYPSEHYKMKRTKSKKRADKPRKAKERRIKG